MEFDDFEKWNNKVELAKEQNNQLFKEYETWLHFATISDKERAQYLAGITFYANTYLIRFDVISVENGYQHIDEYLGDFFIREVPWASPETIEITGHGFSNFFLFLFKAKSFSNENYLYVNELVKTETPKWIKNYHLFNSSCEF